MLTLEKFEEASEVVKQVVQETKLIYSDYFSHMTGNKVYFKPENMQSWESILPALPAEAVGLLL